MNDKFYIRLSSAITVLIILSVLAEVADAHQAFKLFALAFTGVMFAAVAIIGLKRAHGDKIMFCKVRKAFCISGLFYYAGLVSLFLRVLKPEDYGKTTTYLAATLFFGALLLASFFLGLAQATHNNKKAAGAK